MRDDPKNEALRWLGQAEEEHRDAANLATARRFYLSLYLSQQTAEKALKAFLYSKNEEPIFTHSVTALLDAASSLDADFGVLKSARRLDDYYIATRYPNGLPGGIPATYYDDPDEAKTALEWSEAVLDMVRRKLGDPGKSHRKARGR